MKTTAKKATGTATLLRDIVAAFAKYTDDVEVTSKITPTREVLTLRVNADDAPLVQGKWGRVLQALRTIFGTIGSRENRVISLIWSEPVRGQWKETIEQFVTPYKPERITALGNRLAGLLFAEPVAVGIYDGDPTIPVVLEFKVSPAEIDIANALAPFLGLIFSAMGKRQGRDLHLEMTPVIAVPPGKTLVQLAKEGKL
jgi:predicted RNA-binding protein YlqC (UPF0109 family)